LSAKRRARRDDRDYDSLAKCATRASRGSRETDISRYKRERFTAKWIDYSVLRSRQREERSDDC